MRLFFALQPDDAVRDALSSLALDVAAAARGRPIARDNLHLTLFFLGEQPAERAERLWSAANALDATACTLALDHIGTFRGSGVAWIGSSARVDALFALQARLTDALATEGIAREDRPWSPHVTLARSVRARFERPLDAPIEWHVRRLALMLSETRAGGARYRELGARVLT